MLAYNKKYTVIVGLQQTKYNCRTIEKLSLHYRNKHDCFPLTNQPVSKVIDVLMAWLAVSCHQKHTIIANICIAYPPYIGLVSNHESLQRFKKSLRENPRQHDEFCHCADLASKKNHTDDKTILQLFLCGF